jgi:uncharacterized membrane protein
VGADLLHLRQIERMDTGIVSIGGAGTFDYSSVPFRTTRATEK